MATTLKTEKNYTARAIAVDAAENPKVADMASVELLPTFKIYAAGKQLALYEGDRSYDDMLAFCKQHENKVKDELWLWQENHRRINTYQHIFTLFALDFAAAIVEAIVITYALTVESFIIGLKVLL